MAQPSSFVLTPEGKDKYGPWDLSSLIDRKVSLGLASFSGNYVGAVGVGSSGIAYLGINIDLPGRLQYCIDAEQFLVTNLALHSEPHLTYLAVSPDGTNFVAPSPCCHYFLQEIIESPNILIKNPSKAEYVTLDRLDPRFTDLLEIRDNKLSLLHAHGEDPGGMKRTALAAANRSFAPYSKCPSGVALRDRDQNVYKGWYMESNAKSSSLGPVQAALVHFVTCGGTKFDNIVEAVLVEKKYAKVSQAMKAMMILNDIAPGCAFTVFHCL